MYGKAMTFKEVHTILRNNGYKIERTSGGHIIYFNGTDHITLPFKTKALSQKTVNREFKKHGIEVNA